MNISASIRRLASMFVLFFVALSGALVYWQVVVAQAVTSNMYNNRSCLEENAPVRGNIYDRNGVPLAWSVRDPSVYCGYRRVYNDKYTSLAGLVGYYAGPRFASTGVENQYDDYLSGRVATPTLDNAVNQILHRPPLGYDIYLTIDVRIQNLVEDSFDTPTPVGLQKRGAVVVSDPHTGQILAMDSRPTYDPNKLVQTLMHNDLSY